MSSENCEGIPSSRPDNQPIIFPPPPVLVPPSSSSQASVHSHDHQGDVPPSTTSSSSASPRRVKCPVMRSPVYSFVYLTLLAGLLVLWWRTNSLWPLFALLLVLLCTLLIHIVFWRKWKWWSSRTGAAKWLIIVGFPFFEGQTLGTTFFYFRYLCHYAEYNFEYLRSDASCGVVSFSSGQPLQRRLPVLVLPKLSCSQY